MTDKIDSCLSCNKKIEIMDDPCFNMTTAAVVFRAPGNYGSGIWDGNEGKHLKILICDACLLLAAEHSQVLKVSPIFQDAEYKYKFFDPEVDG